MILKSIKLIVICLIILLNNNKEKNINISDIIFHHVNDSHEWSFIKKKNICISLPIILWNNGLEYFSSYNLMNGKTIKGTYGYYRLFKEQIYITNKNGKLNFFNKILYNKKPLDLSITKNVFCTFISSILLIIFFIYMKNKYDTNLYFNKWKIGSLLEYILIFIKDEIAIPYIGKNMYKKYLNFLLSLFFFILINNLLGIIPGFPNITGNINTTFSLSAITFFITILNSKKYYWKHIFWMPKVPIFVKLMLAPIELMALFIRPLTLCIRLFANIMAGHILILSFICLIFIFKNIFIIGFSIFFGSFISLLEIMVSFLQSFIFTNLSALMIGISIKNHNKN
ncbi:F0F1 ATP synthase subunit A [Blattabacterium cuenoti]|uniref:F0F1 ATP synthase subunit A n=1 Tax=Blattabacterium cuenoti TaxID=1653831 RepID=UPI00163B7C64|nr:F0F1 ATP synthase subunit A [Blattabacterium cuenoti]